MSVSFVFPNSPSLLWGGLTFSLPLSIPFLTRKCDPMCFLLGECVGFLPQQEVAAASSSPTRNSAGPFTPLTQGRGWRVSGTLMCPEAALRLLWGRVAQLQGTFGFPAPCGLLLRPCIDCNIVLHVHDEQ